MEWAVTTRKPAGMSFPGWIERQIQTAQADGAFDDLPGKGKPLSGVDGPQHDMAWVASYLRRESVDVASLLPPSLALAKEVETLPDRIRQVRSESEVRRIVDDLNARITSAHALPADGPPMRVKIVDTEATIREWQSRRDAAVPPSSAAPSRSPQRRKHRGRLGWFRDR
jgi:hypothetical protein